MAHHEAPPSVSRITPREDVLTVLADPTCREMLGVMSDESLTAAELAEATEIPLSTVYRKLDQLIDTRLVASTYRVGADGKHPRQYTCNFDRILVRLAEEKDRTLDVTIL